MGNIKLAKAIKVVSRCRYCGSSLNGAGTREHIVPHALGGTKCIKAVCEKCNHEVLGNLDKELCARSPLSLLAAQKLGASVEYAWDVDHDEENLLVEAVPNSSFDSIRVWPQMILDRIGTQIRGDMEEIETCGFEAFRDVFVRHALAAFRSFSCRARSPGLVLEEIPWLAADAHYRYPPRVFARYPIHEFKQGMTFQCRYANADGKRHVLHDLDQWNSCTSFRHTGARRGTFYPSLHLHFELLAILRALTKIGLNLLAAYCKRTKVDRNSFAPAIRFVMGELPLGRSHVERTGLMRPEGLAPLNCPIKSHKFRLLHDGANRWTLYSAFFSAAFCTIVQFPGPCDEHWKTLDVTVPLKSNDWTFHESPIYQPLRVSPLDWSRWNEGVPSLPFVNAQSKTTIKTAGIKK